MIISKAKTLGLVALFLGGKMLLDATQGQASGGGTAFSNSLGGSEKMAVGISFTIGLIGVIFGLRALLTNKVCIGEECHVDQ
ncbi:MAG: hypothetical protein AB3N28_09970 [Kordiimonas sp.]